ncbi:MAG: 3,4-dihydroxy-2-butanone-4-phosphate synthase [Sphingomonas bacterium]|nr:3,4-dihydroxy-2-butanone-4-phosphate synthase [Sphingomonas bacterium]
MTSVRSPSLSAALSRLAEGKMVLITGDALRGGDIDLVIPARFADAAAINFLACHARGLICLALPPERALRMGIALLNSGRERQSGRPFGQSIEAAKGVTTGISAADRARTVAVAIDPANSASDLISPGHVFPLIARGRGVRERAGAVEAAIDLCRMAQVGEAAVMSAVLREDGDTARAEDIGDLLSAHGIVSVDIADVQAALADGSE